MPHPPWDLPPLLMLHMKVRSSAQKYFVCVATPFHWNKNFKTIPRLSTMFWPLSLQWEEVGSSRERKGEGGAQVRLCPPQIENPAHAYGRFWSSALPMNFVQVKARLILFDKQNNTILSSFTVAKLFGQNSDKEPNHTTCKQIWVNCLHAFDVFLRFAEPDHLFWRYQWCLGVWSRLTSQEFMGKCNAINWL